MTTEPIDIPISTDYDDQGAKDAIKDDAEETRGPVTNRRVRRRHRSKVGGRHR